MANALATMMLVATVVAQTASAKDVVVQPTPSYSGMWVTQDGRIRHELLPNNRYVEARGSHERAYEGRYEITGDHIEYWDDSGFTADGDFIDGALHHGGMILYRR